MVPALEPPVVTWGNGDADDRHESRQSMSGLPTAGAGVYGDKLSLFDIKLTVFRGFPFVVIVLAKRAALCLSFFLKWQYIAHNALNRRCCKV